MRTSVVSLLKNDVVIKIIGCCHIGSRGYYDNLQSEISDYTTVLYENASYRESKGVIKKTVFRPIAKVLGLIDQAEGIKYKESWTRSDVHGELIECALPELVHSLKNNNDFEDLAKVCSKSYVMRTLLKVLVNIFGMFSEFSLFNTAKRKVLIELRNNRVIHDVLDLISKGATKHITILYGQAHMPHFLDFFKSIGFKVAETKKYKVF